MVPSKSIGGSSRDHAGLAQSVSSAICRLWSFAFALAHARTRVPNRCSCVDTDIMWVPAIPARAIPELAEVRLATPLAKVDERRKGRTMNPFQPHLVRLLFFAANRLTLRSTWSRALPNARLELPTRK